MGKHCFNSGALDRSLEWFEEAWYLAGKEGNETLRQDQVHTFLDHAAKKVNIKSLLVHGPTNLLLIEEKTDFKTSTIF